MSDFYVLNHDESRELEMVRQFQEKFETPILDCPGLHTREMHESRLMHMQEELNEYSEAWEDGNVEGVLDALVDLMYVALGTVNVHGFSPLWIKAFLEVHRANMAKEKVDSPENSKRNCRFDIVKPEGWTPPDLQSILREYPSNGAA